MKDYTQEELIEICASNPHPEVRRCAAKMLYSLGTRDHAAEVLKRYSAPAELVPA